MRNKVKKKKTTLLFDRLTNIWIATGIIILVGFFIYSFVIGGSAGPSGLGYCENGKYYVGSHGDFTQVPEPLWRLSYVWEILFWIFIPLTPIGAFVISHIHEKVKRRQNRLE
jgi:hypothetical protein